jgi:hypothetical protein
VKQNYYIVTRNGKIWRVDDDGLLSPKEDRQAGTLFDDYGQARNAIKRTSNSWKNSPFPTTADDFEILRVEL